MAAELGLSLPKSNGGNGHGKPDATAGEKPQIYNWGDSGPPQRSDEIRRHCYSVSGCAMKIKIKFRGDRFTQWYRAFRDDVPIGWQAQRPDDYVDVPYFSAPLNPFDPELQHELQHDEILWPEGEKDVQSLSKLGLPAFTFGGVGDGLPDGIAHYLKDRRLVILADNDQPGREHADKKAGIAKRAGAASIKVVHFPELPEKGDVSDFINARGTIERLHERIDATPLWLPLVSDAPLEATKPALLPTKDEQSSARLVIRCAAEIEPEKIDWLWPGRIARGKHTCIAGEPGTGKSQLSTAIIAAITTGGLWPCGEGKAPLGNVILLSAEDGAADTIVPRLDAAGADRNRVYVVSAVHNPDGSRRTLHLQNDLDLLERRIGKIGDVALVVIDPISSYLGKTDSHKNSEVRGVLEPLSEMAERTRVAILSVTHFSKSGANNTTKALHRFIGSIAFTGAPRAAFAVIDDVEHDGRRLFLHAKINFGPPAQGLAFRLEQCLVGDGIVASRIVWDTAPVAITANEALAADAAGIETRTAKTEAMEFLQAVLADEPVPASEIGRMAREHGLTTKVVRSARETLGVTIERNGFGPRFKIVLVAAEGSTIDGQTSHRCPT